LDIEAFLAGESGRNLNLNLIAKVNDVTGD